jgi:hypothetical protein
VLPARDAATAAAVAIGGLSPPPHRAAPWWWPIAGQIGSRYGAVGWLGEQGNLEGNPYCGGNAYFASKLKRGPAELGGALRSVNRLGVTVPYRSFGDTIPVPTVARVNFLSPKLWYKILPASVAMLFC